MRSISNTVNGWRTRRKVWRYGVSAVALAGWAHAAIPAASQTATTLTPGSSPVGYRIVPLADDARQRTMLLHVWYPAEACRTPMRFGEYTAAEAAAVAPDDDRVHRLSAVPMTACRDSRPVSGVFPALIGEHRPVAWPVHGEYFASHGYLVVMVAINTRGRGVGASAEEQRIRLAQHFEAQRLDLDLALAHATRTLQGDRSRVAVLGTANIALLFAIATPGIRAISLQDTGVFAKTPTTDALRATSSWQPSRLTAPLLYFVRREFADRDALFAELATPDPRARRRIVVDVPGPASHDDLAATGWLRARMGTSDADRARTQAFTSMLAAQHAFFDAQVRGRS